MNDEFGRTVQMRWYKVAGDPETFDPLVGVAWGYNRASLKVWRQDLLAPSLTGQDQLFGYDGLYQVTDRERGVLDVGHTGIVGTPAQQEDFTYDETGNWVAYQQRDAGVLDIEQSRENNVSNQITEIDGSGAGVSYDLNGNMLLVPTGESLEGPSRQLVWDAWNRLRIVKDDEDVVIAEYQYDGQTRRTLTESGGVIRHFITMTSGGAWRKGWMPPAPRRISMSGIRRIAGSCCCGIAPQRTMARWRSAFTA